MSQTHKKSKNVSKCLKYNVIWRNLGIEMLAKSRIKYHSVVYKKNAGLGPTRPWYYTRNSLQMQTIWQYSASATMKMRSKLLSQKQAGELVHIKEWLLAASAEAVEAAPRP